MDTYIFSTTSTLEPSTIVVEDIPSSVIFAGIISSCKKYREQENDSYESYRYELWKNLVDNNYNFDFVGRQKDYGTYEEYLGEEFDNDHEGAGGYESEDVLDDIDDILAAISSPDIILLSIGGNDLLDGGNPPSEPIENIVKLVVWWHGPISFEELKDEVHELL